MRDAAMSAAGSSGDGGAGAVTGSDGGASAVAGTDAAPGAGSVAMEQPGGGAGAATGAASAAVDGAGAGSDGEGGGSDEAKRRLDFLASLVAGSESMLYAPVLAQELAPVIAPEERAQQERVWQWLGALAPDARADALTWTDKEWVGLVLRMHSRQVKRRGQGFFHVLSKPSKRRNSSRRRTAKRRNSHPKRCVQRRRARVSQWRLDACRAHTSARAVCRVVTAAPTTRPVAALSAPTPVSPPCHPDSRSPRLRYAS